MLGLLDEGRHKLGPGIVLSAGVLRLHQMAHQPWKYYKPEQFYWSTLRLQNVSIQKILSDIQSALGYEGDERRVFTIQNPWNQPSGP
uniref:Uncharacterized protein n=1 Tax=Romanomermis culicivorax TaxID=13658 RepID=A0A915KNB9_ROMCU